MSSISPELQTKLERLTPEQQITVIAFIESLLKTERPYSSRGLKFDWCVGPDAPPEPSTSKEKPQARPAMTFEWAGCLADLRDQYTSVELQKEANRWREEMALGYLQQREPETEEAE